jgi:DNA repair protein RadD
MQLRQYQQELIDKTRELLKTHRSIIVCLATGGGKSVIEASVLKMLADNNKRGYLLTHRHEIFKQLVGHCVKQNIEPGQIVSGQRMTNNLIQVAMVQTLFRKLKYIDKIFPDLIVADEVHHYTSPTFSQIINHRPETKIIGFTATPARTDGAGLNIAGFTAMIQGPQNYDLVKAGFLTVPVVLSSETTKLFRQKKFKMKNKEIDTDDHNSFSSQKIIVDDTVNCYKNYFNGAPCIVFCCSVADSVLMASVFRGAGWNAEALHEKIPKEERQTMLDGLSNGKLNIITCYEIISEGVDVPVLSGIIIRRLTCSLINWLQWVGRALRKSPGKKQALIIDQAGNIFNHGHPLIIREWSLDGKSKIKDEDDSLKIKQCPACAAWIMSKEKICPYCSEDLTSVKPDRPEKIKIINAPLIEIKPPEIMTGRDVLELSEIMECSEQEIDNEIIERIKHINNNKRERLEMIGKYFNKSNTWTNEVWDKFIKS